jgi:predicted phosphodiesterase
VVAVRGNIDTAAWAQELPLTVTIEAHSARVFVIHNVHELEDGVGQTIAFRGLPKPGRQIGRRHKAIVCPTGIEIVISGHSHKPAQIERKGILYLNPGSAGPRRFRLPITVARLDLARQPWHAEFIELPALS